MRKVRVTIFYENHIAHRTLKEADPMTLVNPRLGPARSIMLEKHRKRKVSEGKPK